MQNAFETLTFPLFAANFDYFRLPRERWELMLARLRQMGFTAVTVTVPWHFHEFERDLVDLNGTTNPRRDLLAGLEACAGLGFNCILKPGPYSSAGILGDGLPAWLCADPAGLDAALPAAVEGWFNALSQALLRWQWPDGPIVALQVDSDRNSAAPFPGGKQLTEVNWRIWLRKHYGGIEALNAAYGTSYHTVNEVKFPPNPGSATTAVERDAQAFLAEVKRETLAGYVRLLVTAGWQIPIYPAGESLPAIRPISLTTGTSPDELGRQLDELGDGGQVIINLPQPIRVDPDPVDVGCGPTWADEAPIGPEGSLWPGFWAIRVSAWRQALSGVQSGGDAAAQADSAELLTAFWPGGGLVTGRRPGSIKVPLPASSRPAAYRLQLTGEVQPADSFKAVRGRLSGVYPADEASPVDMVFFLEEPATPLNGFLRAYLGALLAAQAQALAHGAALATQLSTGLALPAAAPSPAAAERPAPTSYTLAEARRGLREADAALRKAMASIGDLETGFGTILGKSGPALPRPAAAPVPIQAEVFEGAARDSLVETGKACAKTAGLLQPAAAALKQTLAADFTLDHYRQAYSTAAAAARSGRDLLQPIIARLRLEIASEQLPLVTWRVHNQVQEISESLRWGVLRR